MVKHADHYSYVKNIVFTKVGNFLLPKRGRAGVLIQV